MNDFFDDYFNVHKMPRSKREYKKQMARVNSLPEEYGYVFRKIQEYMWRFVSGAGYDMLKVQYELIDLFEEGAADGKAVLAVTGKDVAAFVDELLKNTKTYTQDWREELNRKIQNKVGGGRS